MKIQTKSGRMVLTAMMAALLAVMAQIILPIGPVPFSMATFALFFIGAIMPPTLAAASVGVYLLMGVVGLPVFSGFRGGLSVLLASTGGYLAGYVFVALAVALVARHTRRVPIMLLGAAAGLAACYLLGTLWFAYLNGVGLMAAFATCVLPFILPDAVKAFVGIVFAQMITQRLNAGKASG